MLLMSTNSSGGGGESDPITLFFSLPQLSRSRKGGGSILDLTPSASHKASAACVKHHGRSPSPGLSCLKTTSGLRARLASRSRSGQLRHPTTNTREASRPSTNEPTLDPVSLRSLGLQKGGAEDGTLKTSNSCPSPSPSCWDQPSYPWNFNTTIRTPLLFTAFSITNHVFQLCRGRGRPD